MRFIRLCTLYACLALLAGCSTTSTWRLCGDHLVPINVAPALGSDR